MGELTHLPERGRAVVTSKTGKRHLSLQCMRHATPIILLTSPRICKGRLIPPPHPASPATTPHRVYYKCRRQAPAPNARMWSDLIPDWHPPSLLGFPSSVQSLACRTWETPFPFSSYSPFLCPLHGSQSQVELCPPPSTLEFIKMVIY